MVSYPYFIRFSYSLVGITFRSARMEHYLSNFKLGGIWYSFDALQPETRRVSRAREFDKCKVRDGKVSHVIYVLETK